MKSKNKTDKKDAEKIAKAASKENLPRRIVMPPESERELRGLMRERKRFQKMLAQNGNVLRAYGIESGFELEVNSLSQSMANWEKALPKLKGTIYEQKARRW